MSAASGWYPWGVSGDAPGRRGLWCLPGSAEGLRWHTLSGIEKPGSGTEPIHQEHVMCSRFRGSCPSDVKSAGHPEPGFPIPLTGCSAALCTPSGAQKRPGGRKHRSIPPQSQTLSSVHPKPGVEPLPFIWPGCHCYAVFLLSCGLRACLKTAFCRLCITLCGRFGSDEGGAVGCAD